MSPIHVIVAFLLASCHCAHFDVARNAFNGHSTNLLKKKTTLTSILTTDLE